MSYNQQYPPNQPPYPPHSPNPQGYHQPPYPQQQAYPAPPPPQGGYHQQPYAQQPGYGAPPPAQHGFHGPPPGQGQFGHPPPPPQQGGYPGPPPPHGYGHQAPAPGPGPGPGFHAPSPQPPYGAGAGPGYLPPPPGPPGTYGGPVGGAPAPPPMGQGMPPAMPSLGYAPGQTAPGDFRREADILRKAMKGFGTDERTLIQVLSKLDPLQMAAVRSAYTHHVRRDLYKDVKSETSGYFEQGLLAVINGPLMHDVSSAREAVQGVGTKEWLLNEVLLGRSNADLSAIKAAYERSYGRTLAKDVEDDLSFKTRTLFTAVLRASRHEESAPLHPQQIEADAQAIHSASSGRVHNATEVCGILARSSDNEIRGIDQAFSNRFHTSLEKHLEKEFSGHMKDALVYMVRTAVDPAMRDAVLLEESMAGMGTKDVMLVGRAVRVHWNRGHLDQVKRAYKHRFGKDLVDRVRGETSGDYQRLMVGLLE